MGKVKMITCRRCGKCCYYVLDGIKKKCKYLRILSDGTTMCRIYYRNNRVGIVIDKDTVCIPREYTPYDYVNCPYNTGKKELW